MYQRDGWTLILEICIVCECCNDQKEVRDRMGEEVKSDKSVCFISANSEELPIKGGC